MLFVALALVTALTVHACHAHEGTHVSSQFHATCVVCSLGSPTAVQAVAFCAAETAPLCFLSIEDRDHAMPPARVDVDLSRAPPASLVS